MGVIIDYNLPSHITQCKKVIVKVNVKEIITYHTNEKILIV